MCLGAIECPVSHPFIFNNGISCCWHYNRRGTAAPQDTSALRYDDPLEYCDDTFNSVDSPKLEQKLRDSKDAICKDLYQHFLAPSMIHHYLDMAHGSWADWSSPQECDISEACSQLQWKRTRSCNISPQGLNCLGSDTEIIGILLKYFEGFQVQSIFTFSCLSPMPFVNFLTT